MSEKTYAPKRGDRVRVLLEGFVSTTDPTGFYLRGDGGLSSNYINPDASQVVSVEKVLKPLEVGDVIPAGELAGRIWKNGSVIVDLDDEDGDMVFIRIPGDRWWGSYDAQGDEPAVTSTLAEVNEAGYKVAYLP